jgi:hypothetical protein
MNAKITGRICKIEGYNKDTCQPSAWFYHVQACTVSAHDTIKSKRQKDQEYITTQDDFANLQGLRTNQDVDITLPGLDAYISKSDARTDVVFSSNFAPTFANPHFSNEDLPSDFDGRIVTSDF